MSDWYNAPVIIPQIASSDHRVLLMQPTGRGVHSQVQYKVNLVRSRDPNGKALLLQALKNLQKFVEPNEAFHGTI